MSDSSEAAVMVIVPPMEPTFGSVSLKDKACGGWTGGRGGSNWEAAARAFRALMRPPDITFPPSLLDERVLLMMISFTCAALSAGRYIHTSAARPLTCGVAIDVPLLTL